MPVGAALVACGRGAVRIRSMRVLALVTDAYGGYGGIAQFNRDLTSSFADHDAVESVRVVPRLAPDANDGEQSPKVRQDRAIHNRLFYALNSFRVALQYKPHVVFCGHLYMAPLAYVISKFLRVPFWLQLHGLEAWQRPSAVIRSAAERADLITIVSRHTRGRFLSWANVAPHGVRILPNTFDTPGPAPATKDDLKQRYGLAGFTIMLTVSRIDSGDRYKGHHKVLAILPKLLESRPDLVYVVVGDGNARESLEGLASQLGVSASVRFVGRVSRQALHDYYRLADVFIMPSTKEGFGIVFLEAASFGLPVIGGNVDGSVDALGEGGVGVAVNPDVPESLAAAVESVLAPGSHRFNGPQRFSRQRFSRHVADLLRLVQETPRGEECRVPGY